MRVHEHPQQHSREPAEPQGRTDTEGLRRGDRSRFPLGFHRVAPRSAAGADGTTSVHQVHTGRIIRRVRESGRVARWRGLLAYRARKLPMDIMRLLWFMLRGHGRWIVKGWTWATYADLRGDVRQARIVGDPQARREAQERSRGSGYCWVSPPPWSPTDAPPWRRTWAGHRWEPGPQRR